MTADTIYNYLKVSETLSTAGQPTAEQLGTLGQEGFTAVINLAPISATTGVENEAALVQTQGLAYVHIPVDWNAPTETDWLRFENAFRELAPGRLLLHCAANYRATAFYSLFAQKHAGWSASQAQAFRARIWAGSHYPIWDDFIARMEARLADPPAPT